MKHEGKASAAALKLIGLSLAAVLGILVLSFLAKHIGAFVLALSSTLLVLWVLFVAFTFWFFRDPEPGVPTGKGLVVSPGHGKVDVIDKLIENRFMGGECQRISMFLSVIDIHVQNVPVSGRIALCEHKTGQFVSATRTDSAEFNENVLIGIEASDPANTKIGVRLIAGLIARRIIPWVNVGEIVARGERMSLIQFGSRVDVYLPHNAKIKVKLGDKVVGGESILATFE